MIKLATYQQEMKIGLISDTHGHLDQSVLEHFQACDEIWHAGDIGSLEVMTTLESFKPVRAVYGNIDGAEIRNRYPEHQRFNLEGKEVWITHIGGRPGRYDRSVREELRRSPPDIFVCGHSHNLQVMTDDSLNKMLYLNPGAAGLQGFHRVKTLIRFDIENKSVGNMQVIELGKRGK